MLKVFRCIAVIALAIIVQFLLVAPFTPRPVNLARIPYRQEQRGEAMVAAIRDPTPENKGALDAELRLAANHVAWQRFTVTSVVLIAVLGFEGLVIYLGRKRGDRRKAVTSHEP